MNLSQWLLIISVLCAVMPIKTKAETDMTKIERSLRPCSGSPNCVSTKTDNLSFRMEPLPFTGPAAATQEKLKQVLESIPRSEITLQEPGYIAVLFRSLIFGFIDEAEFLIDETDSLIHFRSGARTGYYDFGVNRSRLEGIAKKFAGDE